MCKKYSSIMVVKAMRIFLATVVLITSVANLLFVVENWNIGNIERTARRLAFKTEEDRRKIVLNEAIDASPTIEGTPTLITTYLN